MYACNTIWQLLNKYKQKLVILKLELGINLKSHNSLLHKEIDFEKSVHCPQTVLIERKNAENYLLYKLA